jgi:hypothetical protein
MCRGYCLHCVNFIEEMPCSAEDIAEYLLIMRKEDTFELATYEEMRKTEAN